MAYSLTPAIRERLRREYDGSEDATNALATALSVPFWQVQAWAQTLGLGARSFFLEQRRLERVAQGAPDLAQATARKGQPRAHVPYRSLAIPPQAPATPPALAASELLGGRSPSLYRWREEREEPGREEPLPPLQLPDLPEPTAADLAALEEELAAEARAARAQEATPKDARKGAKEGERRCAACGASFKPFPIGRGLSSQCGACVSRLRKAAAQTRNANRVKRSEQRREEPSLEELSWPEYQRLAMRTRGTAQYADSMASGGLGLAGEAGEVADHIKKHLFHGHDLDRDALAKELGDVLWYIALLLDTTGLQMADVLARNVRKLQARYPQGFSEEASRSRSA